MFEVVARAVLTVGLVTALLWVARSLVAGPGRLLGTLTDSIYTVYLFHYVTIYALGLLLLRVVPAGPVYYLILSPLVIVLLVAFHRHVVARSPALRLLFNGRPTGRAGAGRVPGGVSRAGDVPRAERFAAARPRL